MHAQFKLAFLFAFLAIISVASASVHTWGFNSAGELGSGSSTIGKIITTPSPINATIMKNEKIQDICCGENFCVAVGTSGSAYSWGDNTVGQLGDGSGINQASPVLVKTKEKITSISCGQGHVLAKTNAGKVLAWGWNYRGQVADNMDKNIIPTPKKIAFFDQNFVIVQVEAGYQHSMALTNDGTVYTWGDNSMGQLGTGRNFEQPFSNVPNPIHGLPAIALIGTGEDHSFAVPTPSSGVMLFAWGDNAVGQLGTGSTSDQPTYLPVRANITSMNNFGTIVKITGGAAHSLAIMSNGNIFVWGANTFGQLGTGDRIDEFCPTMLALPNFKTAKDVSGGLLHSLIVDTDGNVWAFGGNATGQCGDGDQQDLVTPVKISVNSVSKVAAGKFFSASA